jgi:hypothetical protein
MMQANDDQIIEAEDTVRTPLLASMSYYSSATIPLALNPRDSY